LIQDLKQRGLLEDTWSSGAASLVARFIHKGNSQTRITDAIIIRVVSRCGWPGAALKPGLVYGETDEMCYNVVQDPVHVRDLHATILHQLGLQHEKLSFKFQGLDQRLTGWSRRGW
jgi:hypothetical protein